ncbi:beta-galactoside alpha-2,6-sialyltransferase (sialyltransferase 2) [Sarotherodon galilaeus]
MDYAERILTLTTTIKKMVDTMKSNKEYCSRIADRVKAVEGPVLNIRQRDPSQISDTVDGALRELYVILNSAKTLMNFQVLSGALQIEQTNMLQKVYEAVSGQSTEEEVCSMMANTTLTPPMFPPAPVSSPTVPMPQPAQVSSPSVPMFQPAPVSHPQHPQLPPTPISSPTSPIFSSIPMSNPTAAMPVTYVMSPMSVSTPYVRQPVYNTTKSRFIVTNNIASRPVMQAISQGSVTGIRTVAPITLPAQNRPTVSAYVVKNAFLR